MVLARLASAGTATKLAAPRFAGFEAWVSCCRHEEIFLIRNCASAVPSPRLDPDRRKHNGGSCSRPNLAAAEQLVVMKCE